jgi:hypothetical protein
MKCANPDCNRGIGLVAHRRGWFGKRLYCSTKCRDTFVVGRQIPLRQERVATTYFEWLFLQPIGKPQSKLRPVNARMRAR